MAVSINKAELEVFADIFEKYIFLIKDVATIDELRFMNSLVIDVRATSLSLDKLGMDTIVQQT